jgi:phosphatidylserine/phosphatidylglycerophosphate/cardiolipin synthase-like enzyme
MSNCEVHPGADRLIDRIREEAAEPSIQRIRLALGYLFVPGLQPLWDALEASSAGEIHFLIGNTAGVQTEEQRVAAAATFAGTPPSVAPEHDMAATARADRDLIIQATTEALRENLRHFAQNGENARFLRRLASAIGANRLRVRIYPDGRLHSKASLFDRIPAAENSESASGSVAVVGASNLTLPGIGNPTEMNVIIRDPQQVTAVGTWFDTLWAAGQDFTRAFFLELTQQATGEDPVQAQTE